MPRGEMLTRMDSQELSGWWALFHLHGQEAERQRHIAESGDGQVFVSGHDDDDEE